ncbi:MAG: A/G-specific adenine glycosylase [Betaproteobacteria bacterium]|nr:A/G-specific adenine glycosylase [Betaproteobacteria bacterium]
MPKPAEDFAKTLVAWQRHHGRHDLPWQATRDPYRIWVSEIMLQQTQVATVIPYYARFMARFPDVRSLAAAREEEVLELWAGLGYYARGRNLHAAARAIAARPDAGFPRRANALSELPGIGRSTAAAIAVFAWNERAAILDGNVKRVLARCFGIEGFPGERAVETRLWALAQELLPRRAVRGYTQGLMDLGATLCTRTRPHCERCPYAGRCEAKRTKRVDELPTRRPRKIHPLREATWLVLRDAGRVLLQRRPPQGLWGGLWTFPEIERDVLRARCRNDFGCELRSTRPLAPIEHSFTHFRLRAVPLLCIVSSIEPRARSSGLRWVELGRATAVAAPAPVHRLLAELSAL